MNVRAAVALGIALLGTAGGLAGAGPGPAFQRTSYRDGHARPRALAYDAAGGLLYVALSTVDAVAVVAVKNAAPRVVARVPVCRFPDAIVALPEGGALVACRFSPGLRRLRRAQGRWRVETLAAGGAGADMGARGLALSPSGRLAYVASPAHRGVDVVALAGGPVQTLATGLSPRALRVVAAGRLPGQRDPLLLVSNFIEHTVTVHPLGADERPAAPVQTIRTEAPVLDMVVVGQGAAASLWLLTHEDRAVSRANGPVEGLDSGVLQLNATTNATPGAPLFDDPGPGRRPFANLGERTQPVIELGAVAGAFAGGGYAIVGAGSDNLLVGDAAASLADAVTVGVGANPSAVAALPDGRFVTADRLSDTLTFVADGRVEATLVVGAPARPTPAERGELMFYSRALVPNNVADGPRSLYTCAACHDDGHVDGRRHPAKRNRFFSMTESCRGIGTTAPYLTLGAPATIDAFADNIVATHAQGGELDPTHFDKYPVTLHLREKAGGRDLVLSPADVRQALARYMERIPPEPSPYVAPARRGLSADEGRGLALFRDACAGCHRLVGNSARDNRIPSAALERRLAAGEVALTSPRRYAVGTPVLGEGGNNPPSLRGVWDAAPYFSDGSARTLEELLARTDPNAETVHAPENAKRPSAFSADERFALLQFLRAL